MFIIYSNHSFYQGAFWGLIAGLAIGIVKFITEISYRAPYRLGHSDYVSNLIPSYSFNKDSVHKKLKFYGCHTKELSADVLHIQYYRCTTYSLNNDIWDIQTKVNNNHVQDRAIGRYSCYNKTLRRCKMIILRCIIIYVWPSILLSCILFYFLYIFQFFYHNIIPNSHRSNVAARRESINILLILERLFIIPKNFATLLSIGWNLVQTAK